MCNKHKLLAFAFVLILFFYSTDSVFAQVIINEFSSSSNPEWIEFYNFSATAIDLTGWSISDASHAPKPLVGTIEPSGYFVFESLEGWLNNSGSDTITLKNGVNEINSVVYGSGGIVGIPAFDKSAGRVPDNSSEWQNNLAWTKGSPNPSPTPTPTSTPTPTPTPSPTPSPTTASTATPTPTPTKTPTPTPTKSPTSKPTSTPRGTTSGQATSEETAAPQSIVLGLEDKTVGDEASESAEDKKSFSFLPFLFIAAGLGCIGVALFLVLKKGKGYNEKSEEKS